MSGPSGGEARRMRKGWRLLLALLGTALLGMIAPAAPAEPKPEAAARVTLEVGWGPGATPSQESPSVEMEMSEGRIVEAISWPEGTPIASGAEGRIRPGRSGRGRSGKVRASVEAPIGASLRGEGRRP